MNFKPMFWPKSSASLFKSIIPLVSPQSSSAIITSCATSMSLRVKYPAVDVLKAVSAVPFLAPCVEMKYSRTSNPSLKDDFTGSSMILPAGLITKPFMPAICTGCDQEPLAPESIIENTEPERGRVWGMSFSIEDFTLVHISITLAERSSLESKPLLKCVSIISISFSAAPTSCPFSGGTIRSSMPQVVADLVAYSKPSSFMRSRISWATPFSYECMMSATMRSIFFAFICSFTNAYPSGKESLKMERPSVVSINGPFSSRRTATHSRNPACPCSCAKRSSSFEENVFRAFGFGSAVSKPVK